MKYPAGYSSGVKTFILHSTPEISPIGAFSYTTTSLLQKLLIIYELLQDLRDDTTHIYLIVNGLQIINIYKIFFSSQKN